MNEPKEELVNVHDVFMSHLYRLIKSRGIDREIKELLYSYLIIKDIKNDKGKIVPKELRINSYDILSTKAQDLDVMAIIMDVYGNLIYESNEKEQGSFRVIAIVEVIFDLAEDKWKINIKDVGLRTP